MSRPLVVGVLFAALAVAIGVFALVQRGDGNPVVAKVGHRAITRDDLDLTIDHFHEEADREGRPFPDRESAAYKQVQLEALRLLIDQAAVEAAASRLGVHVSDAQVETRLAATTGGESEGGGDIRVKAEAAFRRATVRSQLIAEAVFRKLTARVAVPPAAVRAYFAGHRRDFRATTFRQAAPVIRAQLLAARKNAVYARWLANVRRTEPKPKL